MFFGDEHVHEHVHEYGEMDGNLDFTVIHGSEKHAKHIPTMCIGGGQGIAAICERI